MWLDTWLVSLVFSLFWLFKMGSNAARLASNLLCFYSWLLTPDLSVLSVTYTFFLTKCKGLVFKHYSPSDFTAYDTLDACIRWGWLPSRFGGTWRPFISNRLKRLSLHLSPSVCWVTFDFPWAKPAHSVCANTAIFSTRAHGEHSLAERKHPANSVASA